MTLITLDGAAVEASASNLDAITLADRAFRFISRGGALSLPRAVSRISDQGLVGTLSGSVAEAGLFGTKLVSIFPGNPARGLPLIQGVVALFDLATGAPRAFIDAATITLIRTAAASAAATRLLARPEANSLGILGAGAQALAHAEAIARVRDLDRIMIWSRSPEKALALAEEVRRRGIGEAVATPDPRNAAGSDIVCAVTASPLPVIDQGWLSSGAHINLVGAHSPETRELVGQEIARARVYVDCRASAEAEAGDILMAMAEGMIDTDHVIGEIGQLLEGAIKGRQSADDLTIFKSVGHFAQDLVTAEALLAVARV